MIALACDHGGFELMQIIKAYLDSDGLAYKDFGTYSAESCDYPMFGISAARAVASGECGRGILICVTGIGMSIAANKIPGIRAALCTDCRTAELTRRHNDSNVLTMGALITGPDLAVQIVGTWLSTAFEGGRHARRVDMINALDR